MALSVRLAGRSPWIAIDGVNLVTESGIGLEAGTCMEKLNAMESDVVIVGGSRLWRASVHLLLNLRLEDLHFSLLNVHHHHRQPLHRLGAAVPQLLLIRFSLGIFIPSGTAQFVADMR